MNNKSLLVVVVILLMGIFAVLTIQAETDVPALFAGIEEAGNFGSGSAAMDNSVQNN